MRPLMMLCRWVMLDRQISQSGKLKVRLEGRSAMFISKRWSNADIQVGGFDSGTLSFDTLTEKNVTRHYNGVWLLIHNMMRQNTIFAAMRSLQIPDGLIDGAWPMC